jgi:hypothetical protein
MACGESGNGCLHAIRHERRGAVAVPSRSAIPHFTLGAAAGRGTSKNLLEAVRETPVPIVLLFSTGPIGVLAGAE